MSRVGQYATATLPALAILGFFVWFANWIPQTRWDPPQKLQISSSMTPAQLAAAGDTITRQRGCLACHTVEPGAGVQGGGRGPNWAGIATRRAQGVSGGPSSLAAYLVQALYAPGAYLVEGYANIMPTATSPPAKLTYEEVTAVVAYLQSLGGTPTVKVGDLPRPSGETGSASAGQTSAANVTEPTQILATFGCTACHSLKSGETLVGPALVASDLKQTASARNMSAEAYVMESIVSPKAFEKAGFPSGVMPQDLGTKLTAGQLSALASYLLSPGEQR